jgi:autotransporter family porin
MLHGRPHLSLVRALFVALIAALLVAPAAQAAKGHFGHGKKVVVPVKNLRGGVATFRFGSITPEACRAARLRVGNRERTMRIRRVRAAMRRHQIRVRLRRGEWIAARRRTPRLVIFRSGRKPAPPRPGNIQPLAPAPESPASLETADDTPTTVVTEPTQPAVEIPSGPKSIFRPAGGPVLSDAEAAARVRPSGPEKRPANGTANQTVPTQAELAAFRAANSSLYQPHEQLVTGNFRGTTDEIIQWAAWKWGIDEDVFRAQAVQESWWNMSQLGDGGVSYGLFQIKRTVHFGTHPLSVDSTAFNADYTGALFRYYYDGHADWLMDVEHGRSYEIGDQWGAIGAHFAGAWWTSGAADYVADVKGQLADRTWERSYFE